MNLTKMLILAIVVMVFQGCASTPQGRDEVEIREPGNRIGGVSQDLRSVAPRLYPYAAMSTNVYKWQTAGDANRQPLTDEAYRAACPDDGRHAPDDLPPLPIGAAWDTFPDFPLKAEELDASPNLRVQLWKHRAAPGEPIDELVVAFRGTQFNHLQDWISNFRWFGRSGSDHYTHTKTDIAEQLQALIANGLADGSISPAVRVSTTGHSLGGGLAQHMAYAFRAPEGTDLVPSMVVAFDPSPVTGWHEVEPALRERNAEKLCVERVFEKGEILWYVREAIAAVYPPSEVSPAISGVRLDVKRSPDPFSNHSMRMLACALAKAQIGAGEGQRPSPDEALNHQMPPGREVTLAAEY